MSFTTSKTCPTVKVFIKPKTSTEVNWGAACPCATTGVVGAGEAAGDIVAGIAAAAGDSTIGGGGTGRMGCSCCSSALICRSNLCTSSEMSKH